MKILRAIPVLVVAGLLFTGSARVVWADPHAVFYTAIGQQQLFFNVLAALDQADYVEPAAGASGVSRQELLEDRTGTDFGPPSQDERLTKTATTLSSVLTRNITLEGYDLWTAYQLQNRANDFQRTVAIAEFARLLCQETLGIKLCDVSDASNYTERSAAIVTNHAEWELNPIERGALAVLLSGSPQDQAIRREILQKQKDDPHSWEYNPSIAAAWEAVTGDTQKQQLLDSVFSDALSAFVPAQVDPTVYERIASINEDGTINHTYSLAGAIPPGTVLAQNSQTLEGLDYTAQYITDIYALVRNRGAALETAGAAEQNARNEQKSENKGFKATTYFEPGAAKAAAKDKGNTSAIGRIGTRILSPAESKVASTQAIKDAGVISDNSRTSAPAEGQFQPGDQPLLAPFDPDQGNVQGIQSNTSQSDGQVKGAISDFLKGLLGSLGGLGSKVFGLYDKTQPQLDVRENIQPAHNEQGLQDALTALDPAFSDAGTQGGGFSPGLQSLWASYCNGSDVCF